ncbi:MAG: S1/P1 Nuclease, partial [Bacteroidetes bacterium]|nr:S1/P1 Nuclease [Bacteroidota bacterium]
KWKEAVEKFGEDSLNAYGIAPWSINLELYRLTQAFLEMNSKKILRLSAELGHYLADVHVPLHTTVNYNGQLSGQHGIHAFWESRLPELFGEDYNYWIGKAKYIESPANHIWEIILQSAALKDSVLLLEKQLSLDFPADQRYTMEDRGQAVVKAYSRDYSKAYSKLLNGMVEKRMRESIRNIASLWYTCWVNAGQPDLNKLDVIKVDEKEVEGNKKVQERFRLGKILGRKH